MIAISPNLTHRATREANRLEIEIKKDYSRLDGNCITLIGSECFLIGSSYYFVGEEGRDPWKLVIDKKREVRFGYQGIYYLP